MKIAKSILIMVAILVPMHLIYGQTTYYVSDGTGSDSYDGSSATVGAGSVGPFKTIGYGLSQMQGGDILKILGGQYDETLDGDDIPSGTSSSPTVIEAYNSQTVEIIPQVADKNVVRLYPSTSDIEHIHFKSLVLDGSSVTTTSSIYWDCVKFYENSSASYTVHDLRFEGCEMKDALGSGIYVASSASDNEFVDLSIYDNGPANTNDSKHYHGIYNVAPQSLISGCNIYNNSGTGIKLGTDDSTVAISGIVIENTSIHGHPEAGIYCGSGPDGCKIFNNIIYDNDGQGIKIVREFVSVNSPANLEIQNNTFALNGGQSIFAEYSNTLTCSPNPCPVKNNLAFKNRQLLSPGPDIDMHSSLNLSKANNIEVAIGNSHTYITSESSPYDFSLPTGSKAIDCGTDLSGSVDDDIDGTTRPKRQAYDVGAYEYESSSGYTYYVATTGDDTDPGTFDKPFKTIDHGVSVLSPGDKLYVRGGTYTETVSDFNSGTSGSPITVESYQSETVTVKAPSTGTAVITIGSSAAISYVDIKGLNVDGDQKANYGYYLLSASHHITIEDLKITKTRESGVWIHQNAASNSDHNTLKNLEIHDNDKLGVRINGRADNLIESCTVRDNGSWGILLTDGSSQYPDDNTIVKCKVYGNVNYGIYLSSGTGNEVINSLIYDNSGDGLYIGSSASSTKVYHNSLTANTSEGIYNLSASSTITNNVSYGNTSTEIHDGSTGASLNTNHTTDPSFVSGTSPFDLSLQSTSAAIDVGTNLASTVDDDISGIARPKRQGYDIGAYEYESSSGYIYYAATTGDDTDPGTFDKPFKTIDHGVSVLSPGDKLYVRGGTYTETVSDFNSGTSGSPITVESYQSETVTVKAPSTGTAVITIGSSAAISYVDIKGLNVDGDQKANYGYYLLSASNHITIEDLKITKTKESGVWIHQNAASNSDHNTLKNLEIHDNDKLGVRINGRADNLIESCTVRDNGSWGILLTDGSSQYPDDNTIVKCKVYGNVNYGIYLSSGTGNEVINSLIYDNSGDGLYIGSSASSTKVYHNSLTANTSEGIYNLSASSTITNNVSYGNTSTEIHDGSTGASLNTNHTTDPLFVSGTSPFDLSLQSTSTAIDAGTNLASTVDDDIDGNSRPYNVDYDIGAYEYQGSSKRRGGEASTVAEVVHVYPNPFSQHLLVELDAEESVGLELYNLQNQRMEISASRDNFSWLIETGDLASGVYILKVQGPTSVRCFKVLKE